MGCDTVGNKAQPFPDDFGVVARRQGGGIVSQVDALQSRGDYAGSGAVAGIDEVILLEFTLQNQVEAARGESTTPDKGVATDHPDVAEPLHVFFQFARL